MSFARGLHSFTMEDTLPHLPKFLCALALLAALAAPAAPAKAAELVDRVVAVVNGKLITLFDVNSQVVELVARTQGVTLKPGDPRGDELRRQVLDSMITDLLIEQEAAKLKVNVSETEIDSQIDDLKKKNSLTQQQLVAELAKEGMTLKQFREKMHNDSIKKRLLGFMVHRKVLVTDDEIRDYYEKNKGSLSTAKSVLGPKTSGGLGFIMVPSKKQAEELRDKINSGAMTFADAAKKFSIGPGRDQGGDLGDVQAKDLAAPLRDALTAAPAGQVSQPVMLDGKAVLLMQRSAQAAPAKPAAPVAASAGTSYEAAKEQIQELLYKQKFDKLFQEYVDNLRSKAVIEVKL
ncbi:Survival protein SurA precursor (Peptidyl-prolyl cis-trans isomerase SurA) [Desulfovibrio sp. DV]|uniref:SurA N-terminal domain-containing protein n=1 Tax=Desulfovibrio sp. DV TaxID=1844708 RepID=UPI00095E8EF1|nr:SurA N-terminal domain-containing protein [Desulfovibrio sp. DV]OLN27405.1 Survival protein SurA precursor (Peptidyl-prolyl cis-trans isomerase SurA) [Desulfovibrio sp. DV]